MGITNRRSGVIEGTSHDFPIFTKMSFKSACPCFQYLCRGKIDDFDISKPSALFFGTERDGLSEEVLQNADVRYESSKKMERIQQLELENELEQKNKLLGYGIAGVLLIGLIFMFRSYYYRQRYYLNREEILKQEQANSDLKMQLIITDWLNMITMERYHIQK